MLRIVTGVGSSPDFHASASDHQVDVGQPVEYTYRNQKNGFPEGIMGIYSKILMTGKKTVLLVEDNPDDEVLALRALRKNGIEEGVSVVRDGAEALDFLFGRGDYQDRSPDVLPTVVLLDLNLPKVNGLEVLRELRAHEETRYLPVVILTTSKEEQDMISGYSFGANSFICKPVDYDQFIQAIEQLGRYWLLLNETPDPSN